MAEDVMALDQGTTSSRAGSFPSRRGQIVSLAAQEFRDSYPRAGWVEHDPLDIRRSQKEAAQRALAGAGLSPSDVTAIGITNQRETVVAWNRRTGKPVYNAVVWQCRRTAEYCDQLIAEGFDARIKRKTGLVTDAYFSGPKMRSGSWKSVVNKRENWPFRTIFSSAP